MDLSKKKTEEPTDKELGPTQKRLQEYREYEKSLKEQQSSKADDKKQLKVSESKSNK